MKVITINHGNVFGTGTWFTFYCSNCERQINAGAKKCLYCGEKADYENPKTTEQQTEKENNFVI